MPHWLTNVPVDLWAVLSEMAPYLLFGFLAAGVLSVLVPPRFVERHLGGTGIWPVFKAAVLGVPMPLCSCGVIPVAASLRKHGASRGATTAFLIATPQDGVDSILVTLSLLGPVFAIFRPIAALVSGLLGGALVSATTRGADAGNAQAKAGRDARRDEPRRGRLYRVFSYGFGALPRDIGKALLAGLLIAAVISAIIPKDYFAAYLGGGLVAMLVMMLVGIPVYVCATASVPIAAALVAQAGISPGAALVFLMTGPATNAATIVTVWKVMGRRTAGIYLAAVMVTALAAGLTLDYVLRVQGVPAAPAMPWMLPGFVKSVSAAALLAILGRAVLGPPFGKRRRRKVQAAGVTKLTVKGMTCTHCAASVERALLECAGVSSAEVDLAAGEASVAGEGLDLQELRSAVTGLGYQVLPPGGGRS